MIDNRDVPLKTLLLRIGLRLLLILGLILFLTLLLPPLLNLFLPFVLAFLAALLLAPIVSRVSKRLGGWNFWSMLFVILMLVAATGLLIYIGYYLVSQISDLIKSWDTIQESITDTLTRLSGFLEKHSNLTSTETEEYLVGLLQDGLSWLTGKISAWAPSVVAGVGNVASGIASFVISLLFFIVGAYFMTADYLGLRQRLRERTPQIIRPHMRHVKAAMGSAMFGYMRAQLILSGVVTLITFLTLLIYGQSYSILIAIGCGIIDIIPFFGSGTVLVPWAVIMLIYGNYQKALVLLILAFVLFLFRKLAEPKVVGNQTGLSPMISLMSIYVGMKIGGVLGMILCPILCMIVVGLYRMDFFTPTITDFRLLFYRIINAARLDEPEAEDAEETEKPETEDGQ